MQQFGAGLVLNSSHLQSEKEGHGGVSRAWQRDGMLQWAAVADGLESPRHAFTKH